MTSFLVQAVGSVLMAGDSPELITKPMHLLMLEFDHVVCLIRQSTKYLDLVKKVPIECIMPLWLVSHEAHIKPQISPYADCLLQK